MKRIIAVWLVVMVAVGGMIWIANLSMAADADNGDAEIRSVAQSKSGLTAHAPIYIDGNDNFTAANGVSNPEATGTASDPYIIENWDIDASSANGIEIRNTDVYFIIRNCVIHDGKSNNKHGIYFYTVQNGKIDNVTSYNNLLGIYLGLYSNNNQISSSQIYNNYFGVYLDHFSNNNILSSSQIYNNSWYGIYLYESSNNNLSNNTFTNDGILIEGYSLKDCVQTIKNNTVNGKPLYYFLSENGITFDNIEVGQLILVNCTDFNIKNLNISYTDVGIELLYSSNNALSGKQIYNNSYGIWLYYSSNNKIGANHIYNNSCGISLSYFSNNNKISANQIYNNNCNGIGLYKSSNNKISANHIYNNFDGIRLCCASNNNLSANQIYNNNYNGISLGYSSNNEIHYNNIYNNTACGVYNDNSEVEYQANATHNWWGSADGPSGVGPGTGDKVSTNLLYIPWLTEPWAGVTPNLIPTVSITSPSPGATLSGTTIVKGTASDPDGIVLIVQIRIDGGSWITVSGTTSWSYTWDTTIVSDGEHTISVRSFDGTDYSSLAFISVNVKNVEEAKPPEIPWLYITIPVVVVIVVAAVVLGIRGRKKGAPPEKPTG